MELKLVNLCNHPITIRDFNGKFWDIPPVNEKEPARVISDYQPIIYFGSIAVYRRLVYSTECLPPPTEGTIYIVSRIVAEANRHRKDLLIPGAQGYDANGNKYCSGLEVL